jgi:hypothetical protein
VGQGANSVLSHIQMVGYFDLRLLQFDRCECHRKPRSSSNSFLRGINNFSPHIHFSISVSFAIRGVHNTVVCGFPDNLRKEGRNAIVGVMVKTYVILKVKNASVVSVLRPVEHQLRSCLVDVPC